MNNDTCPICLDSLKQKFKITTPCSHIFCLQCMLTLYDFSCPYCRYNYKTQLPDKIYNIILQNSKKEPPKKGNINIFNINDFPPLR
jgi:hypothetical protein